MPTIRISADIRLAGLRSRAEIPGAVPVHRILEGKIEGPLHSVSYTHKRLIAPNEWRNVTRFVLIELIGQHLFLEDVILIIRNRFTPAARAGHLLRYSMRTSVTLHTRQAQRSFTMMCERQVAPR